MLVDFKAPWFGPTQVVIKDKIQSISGKRYKVGIQEVDKSLKNVLPKSAVIVDKIPEVKEEKVEESLKDFDIERFAADKISEMATEADEQYEKNKKAKQERMAHAREAKGAKKGNKTVE